MDVTWNHANLNLMIFSIAIAIAVYIVSYKYKQKRAMIFGNVSLLEKLAGGKIFDRHLIPLVLRILAIVLIILSLSDLTLHIENRMAKSDIVIALDTSPSMLTPDFQPNRLEAAKQAVVETVSKAPEGSRIGLVSFAGKAYVRSGLTSDRKLIISKTSNLTGDVPAGTSISDAIIVSSSLLYNTSRERKVIVITDGKNNMGPNLTKAVMQAKSLNITIDVIGIGSVETVSEMLKQFNLTYSNLSNVTVPEFPALDVDEINFIANETGGTVRIAGEQGNLTESLKALSYETVKKDFKVYRYLLFTALVVILIDWFLNATKYSILPG